MTVDGVADRPTGSLVFFDMATLDLRLSSDPGQVPGVARRAPWLRGACHLFPIRYSPNASIHLAARFA